MKWPSFFLFVLTGALLFVLPGCETDRGDKPRARTGETYPATSGTFRDRWWSHYERGLQYASGLNWREAAEDFREAIRRRDRDTRRAKTYGMHFIDYFPHRELGVVLVHQERFEEAIPELEASLRDEKSAKAEFYLDWARKTLLQRAGRDTGPPHIVIQSPDEGAITNRLNCGVTAHVRDDSFVKSVKVGDGYVRLDLAVREVPVQMDVPLAVGNNVLRIEARDLSGNIAVAERKITVDRQGPVISIQAPPDGASPAGSSLRLRGYVTDDCGIAEIKINGQKREHLPGKEILLDFPIPASPELSPTVIEARDLAGNTTRAEIPLSGQVSVFPRILLASLDPLHIALLKSAAARHDSLAPVIELRDWTEHQTVFLDEIYLEGAVKGAGKVSTLTINGHSTLKRAANSVYFSYLARLSEGDNVFSIEATDEAGHRVEKRITIHRKLHKVRQIGSRLRLALMPLERKGNLGLEAEPIEENLLAGIMERKRFDMVERQRLEAILAELRLSRADLASTDSGLRVGKIVMANGILLGSVVGSARSLEIFVHLVDTETSLIITAVDVYGEDVDAATLRELCRALVLKLCDELPLVEGSILHVNGRQASTDLGKQTRIKKGMRLIIFDEGEPIRNPLTGMSLGATVEELAHGVIQVVDERISHAEILEKEALGRIRPMHKVITQ